MLAAILLAVQQPQTVTFTHPCAHSSVTLQELGKKTGLMLEATGSVLKDYFLVRFDKVPVTTALQKIAETLNATWTEKDGKLYLGRTPAQEMAGPKEMRARLEKGIAAYIANDATKVTTWTRDRAATLLRKHILPAASFNRQAASQESNKSGPCRELLDEFIRAVGAKKLASLPEGKQVIFRWTPKQGEQPIPPALRQKALAWAKNIAAFGETAAGLGAPSGGDFDLPGELRLSGTREPVTPDWIAFQAVVRASSIYLIMMPNGTNPSPYASVSIQGRRDATSLPEIPNFEGNYVPSELAELIANRNRDIYANTAKRIDEQSEDGKRLLAWFDADMSPDCTHLLLGEAVQQCVEAAGLNAVVAISDSTIHGLFVVRSARMSLKDVLKQFVETMDCRLDTDGGWFCVFPAIDPMWAGRVDRSATSKFARAVLNEGWARIDAIAELASACESNVTFQWSKRLAALLQPTPYNITWMLSDNSLLSLAAYHSLPAAAKRQSKNGGVTMPVVDLPREARDRLVSAVVSGGFGQVPDWARELHWSGMTGGAYAGDKERTTADLVGASLEVLTESIDAFVAADVRESSGTYVSSIMPVEAAARLYVESRGQQSRIDYGTLAPITAERLVMRLRLADGTPLRFVAFSDSRNAETRYYPVEQLPGEIGDKLRAEIKRLGG